METLTVLYDDAHLVVCVKPAGILSEDDGSPRCMPQLLREHYRALGQSEEDLFPADRYSLMDTMGDLLAIPQTAELIRQACPALWDDPRLLGAKSFTLFKLVNRLSGSFPEDTVKELNRKLGEIAKPAAQ